jgi:hypothetical protein
MVEFVNGKPTGTLAKFRLCIEGSVIKILGKLFSSGIMAVTAIG